jgi:hypothetical protein
VKSAKRESLKESQFAFPKERKEPISDAKHVRNAIARFDQVDGVTDAERDAAWRRIGRAAKRFGVEVSEKSWRALGKPGKKRAKSKKTKKGKKGKKPKKRAAD